MSRRKSRPPNRFWEALPVLLLAAVLIQMSSGCNREAEIAPATAFQPHPETNVPASKYQFETAVRIEAGGSPISVESPGYACPTIADIDGDGVDDLVVGQFRQGKMKWYRNTAEINQRPDYEQGQWIESGSKPAEVPGVS